MENFFYNEQFYSDLTECCNYNDWDEQVIQSFPDDFKIEVELSNLETIQRLSPEWILERIEDERFSENTEDEADLITNILRENIDFEKINALMPKLYYSKGEREYISKQDLLDAIS